MFCNFRRFIWTNWNYSIIEDNIVQIDGRLSIKDNDEISIVANKIHDFSVRMISINITNLEENKKQQLRELIKNNRNINSNYDVVVVDNGKSLPCGSIYADNRVINEFINIVGSENVEI